MTTSKLGLARAIYDMRFQDLVEVGGALWDMTREESGAGWNLKDKREWPALLFSWAENVVDAADDEASKE